MSFLDSRHCGLLQVSGIRYSYARRKLIIFKKANKMSPSFLLPGNIFEMKSVKQRTEKQEQFLLRQARAYENKTILLNLIFYKAAV
jgi:hypothetical protein